MDEIIFDENEIDVIIKLLRGEEERIQSFKGRLGVGNEIHACLFLQSIIERVLMLKHRKGNRKCVRVLVKSK